jgi:outer membrane protein assembly factor BamB
MSPRRDYLSFFGRPRGRGDFVFVHEGHRRIRWLIPALLIAAAGGLAWWWFSRPTPEPDVSAIGVTTVPTILHPLSTTTTRVAGDETLCPAEAEATHWFTFQASPDRAGCREDIPTITDPVIEWTARVGVEGWLNNPVIADDTVYVASAGATQFEWDNADGIYAIDLATGTQVWFYPASFDVNGVAVSGNRVVATGDEGLVWGIDAGNGNAVWTYHLSAAVFTNPLIIGGEAIVGDASGTVTALDIDTGHGLWSASVNGAVRGGAAFDGEHIFVVGEAGEVLALDTDGQEIWRQTITARAGEGAQPSVFAAPTVAGEAVVISLVRDGVYGEPAFIALDRATGDLLWRPTDSAGVKAQWSNVRSSPAVVGGVLVYGEGYSNRLVAISAEDGHTLWSAEVGPLCYPQWASPAVASGQVIIPRFDGGLYAVDVSTETLVWSIYLGQESLHGQFPADMGEDFCEWQPKEGFSVLASPAVADNGTVVVGTLEGWLMAIGDAGW